MSTITETLTKMRSHRSDHRWTLDRETDRQTNSSLGNLRWL